MENFTNTKNKMIGADYKSAPIRKGTDYKSAPTMRDNKRRHCESPSFLKTKNKMTTEFPPRHFDRNTWSASGMYEVEKSVPCIRLLQLQIPPLHMLRWRSACFGRNDGGQVRHCEEERRSNPVKGQYVSSLRGGTTKQSRENQYYISNNTFFH